MKLLLLLTCSGLVAPQTSVTPDYQFPDDFLFGAGTAAYQIEGAWDEDGRGESIWDVALHKSPNGVADQSNADIACDSYHKYKEDVQLLKNLGVDFYRFSISWSRILPSGKNNEINQAGIEYYNNLIDELLANNIQPYVTMFVWDLPQPLQDEGGWVNRTLADYFVDYAKILFENFGDRVKHWMTFNEIFSICVGGYGQGYFAPFIDNDGVDDYQCGHTVLLAHGRTYRLYKSEFKEEQKGHVGAVVDTSWHEPNKAGGEDELASEVAMQMDFGWFVNPMYYGNYPDVLVKHVLNMSLAEGLEESRLPEFTPEEQEMLKGSLDFLGFNHYTTDLVYFGEWGEGNHPSRSTDMGVVTYQSPSWNSSASDWLKVVPWGIRKALVWIKDHYENIPVVVTENGFSDQGELDDYDRASYHRQYLYQVLRAIYEDGCNVVGYTAWSLMDNFEWMQGYTQRFGLHHVDFDDPARPRARKMSSYIYEDIVRRRYIDWEYYPDWPQKLQFDGQF